MLTWKFPGTKVRASIHKPGHHMRDATLQFEDGPDGGRHGVHYPLSGRTVWCADKAQAIVRLDTANGVREVPYPCAMVLALAPMRLVETRA